jgi:hypothetical protein
MAPPQGGGSRLQKLLKLIDGTQASRLGTSRKPTWRSPDTCAASGMLLRGESLNFCAGGSSLETRKAASRQIASIAASHPTQLPSVLGQVSVHLKHKDWDARIAAAHCLGLLAEHFAHPSVANLCSVAGIDVEQLASVKHEPVGAAGDGGEDAGPHTLRFEGFNVAQVLEQGTPLLASWGEVGSLASWLARACHVMNCLLCACQPRPMGCRELPSSEAA